MRKWTEADKLKQSQLIHCRQPWLSSTGPKTQAGKAISKMNSYKHGGRRAEIRNMAKIISRYKKNLSQILKSVTPQ